jgi:hypothetical protein
VKAMMRKTFAVLQGGAARARVLELLQRVGLTSWSSKETAWW